MNFKNFRSQLLLEYNREKTVKLWEDKIKSRIEAYNNDSEKYPIDAWLDHNTSAGLNLEATDMDALRVLVSVEKNDPTVNQQYVTRMLQWFVNGTRMEDITSIAKKELKKFEELKKRRKIEPSDADIGRYKNLNEFIAALNKYEDVAEVLVDKGKYQEVWNDETCRVIIPLDETAACYYGQGSKWCTSSTESDNYFDSYNDKGRLMIILPKKPMYKGEKYQYHFATPEVENEKKEAVSEDHLFQLFPRLVEFIHKNPKLLLTNGTGFPSQPSASLRRMLEFYQKQLYKRNVTRWMEFEELVNQMDVDKNFIVSNTVNKGLLDYLRLRPRRWKEIEPLIINSSVSNMDNILFYAIEMVKERWPEFEEGLKKIIQTADYIQTYAHVCGTLYEYSTYVLKGGRLKGVEDAILTRMVTSDAGHAMGEIYYLLKYFKDIVKNEDPELVMRITDSQHITLMSGYEAIFPGSIAIEEERYPGEIEELNDRVEAWKNFMKKWKI